MSAFGGKADITRTCADVCFWPKADIRSWGLLPARWCYPPDWKRRPTGSESDPTGFEPGMTVWLKRW